jgi:hypothetical protein
MPLPIHFRTSLDLRGYPAIYIRKHDCCFLNNDTLHLKFVKMRQLLDILLNIAFPLLMEEIIVDLWALSQLYVNNTFV